MIGQIQQFSVDPADRFLVLGIDAAWTSRGTSGVALLKGGPSGWNCLRLAASYREFCDGDSSDLISATQAIAGTLPTIVSVDMPLSKEPIIARRVCDQQISYAFGANGCAVHSPTAARPGLLSTQFLNAFSAAGYELAVAGSTQRDRQVIEVYPHVALLRLLNTDYRIAYKVARRYRYWPGATANRRMELLSTNLLSVRNALQERIENIALDLPSQLSGAASFKQFEDKLDAIICAWVGTRYLDGRCTAYGDANAAIWVPITS
jgi:predicted RNase H-like nuclease